jgi:RNA polymerase sigma-70 factor (ECF subfamily)
MKLMPLLATQKTAPTQYVDPLFTDERLMEMIQTRIHDGIGLLRARYTPLLTQISAAVLHNDADVQDHLQEVFVEIWTRSANYDPSKGRPLAWIVTLTRRRAIDRLRKRDTYCRAGDRFAEEMSVRSENWTHVHEDLMQREMREHLQRAMAVLPEAQRSAIQLAYHRQMSQREIAASTGLPLGTVKTRLELGLKKMGVFLRGFEDLLSTGKSLSSCETLSHNLQPVAPPAR